MDTTSYDKDVILWSQEQAALLRSGQFSQLDIEHLADEIEDVGKSEKRDVASRMAVLLAHRLRWQHQPERRGRSWEDNIEQQRERISRRVNKTSGLKMTLRDVDWQEDVWADATDQVEKETGLALATFGKKCPWTMEQVLATDWMPGVWAKGLEQQDEALQRRE